MAYTGSSSKWINPSLYNNSWNEDFDKREYVKLLDRALLKIKPLNNSDLFHMAVNEFTNTKTIKSYLSCSFENFDNSKIIWKVKTKSFSSKARDISKITSNKIEKEVLFIRGSRFKLLYIDIVLETKTFHLLEI